MSVLGDSRSHSLLMLESAWPGGGQPETEQQACCRTAFPGGPHRPQSASVAMPRNAWGPGALCAQVEGMRSEMDGEVSALLEAIRAKSTKLEDANARLTSRLRWGIAVLQAKNELGVKRQVFAWWRCALGFERAAWAGDAGIQETGRVGRRCGLDDEDT